jgi:hypothetical protein
VVLVCVSMIDSAVWMWGGVYLHDVLYASEGVAALAYGAYLVAVLAGRTAADAAVDRFTPGTMVRTGGLLACAGTTVLVSARASAQAFAGLALLGLGLCVVAPQSFAAAARGVASGRDAAVARVNVLLYIGFVLGAPVVGVLTVIWSLRIGLAAQLVLLLVVVTLASTFDVPHRSARSG